jgi:hypothetical protein
VSASASLATTPRTQWSRWFSDRPRVADCGALVMAETRVRGRCSTSPPRASGAAGAPALSGEAAADTPAVVPAITTIAAGIVAGQTVGVGRRLVPQRTCLPAIDPGRGRRFHRARLSPTPVGNPSPHASAGVARGPIAINRTHRHEKFSTGIGGRTSWSERIYRRNDKLVPRVVPSRCTSPPRVLHRG